MENTYNLKAKKPNFKMKRNSEVYASSIVSYKKQMGFKSGINNVIEVEVPDKFQSYAGSTKNKIGEDDESGKVKAHYVLSIENNGILMMELKVIDIAKFIGRHQVDFYTYKFSQHNTFIPKKNIEKFVYHNGWIFTKFLLITNKDRYNFMVSSEPFGDAETGKTSFQYKNYKNLSNLVNEFNK